MIVVDSSVWIQALRSSDSPEAPELGELLDEDRVALVGPVKLEILLGSSRRQEPRLRRVLSALPCWYPDISTWKQAEDWVAVALRSGHRFGFADLLIASIAYRHEAQIWSLDGDFQRLAGLGFASLYES